MKNSDQVKELENKESTPPTLRGIEKSSYSKTELLAVRDHIIDQVNGIFGLLLAKTPNS